MEQSQKELRNAELFEKMKQIKDQIRAKEEDKPFSERSELENIIYVGKFTARKQIEGSFQSVKEDVFLCIKSVKGQSVMEYHIDGRVIPVTKESMQDDLLEKGIEKEEEVSLASLAQQRINCVEQTNNMKKGQVKGYSEIKSMSAIKDQFKSDQRVSRTESFSDIVPEAKEYETIGVVYSKDTISKEGLFTFVGVTKEGIVEKLDPLKPVEGTNPHQEVTTMDRNGENVEEAGVSAMVQVNSKEGFTVRLGSFGVPEIEYSRRAPNRDEYLNVPIETSHIWSTKYGVREMADPTKNVRVDDELEKVEDETQKEPARSVHNAETTIKNIDDNEKNDEEPDDVVVIKGEHLLKEQIYEELYEACNMKTERGKEQVRDLCDKYMEEHKDKDWTLEDLEDCVVSQIEEELQPPTR